MKAFVTEVLTLQQDYLWFLACVSLLGASLAAWRFRAAQGRHRLLGWVLAGNLAMALAEMGRIALNAPPPEMGPPNLLIDLFHGGVLALLVAAVWWPVGRKTAGWVLVGGLFLLAVLRYPYPWLATFTLSVAGTIGLIWRGRPARAEPENKLALGLIPALWLSPIGPATLALNNWVVASWSEIILVVAPPEEKLTALTAGLRRWSTTGPWGVWTALVMAGTGVYCLTVLARRWKQAERDEIRRLTPWVGLWLGGGMALAAGLGWRVRHDFETAQISRANLAAKLLDPTDLAEAFGPQFDPQPMQSGPGAQLMVALSPEFQKAVRPIRRRLALIQAELPQDSFALILVQRNGRKMVGAVADGFATRSDRTAILAYEPDFATSPQTRFLPPFQEAYGLVTQVRAPLFFPDGTFLGWLALEFGPDEWVAGQTQARLLALAIVGLGFGIAILSLRQRFRNVARDEALQAAEIARQADRTKTEFLARVSHELRTPIQSVLGYGELLQSAVQGEAARARLGALRQHGLLMLRLVNDLLDLAALQTGRFHLSPHPTRLFDLVHQTVESMRPRAEAKGLAFHTVMGGTREEWRLADGERVRQVVLNLVANAVKFTDSGSVQVEFGVERSGDLALKVSDTGPGITPGAEARLFQPFARLEGTAAKEGTGLGLVLAKALCESMGGGIALEPQSRGACFVARFRLPVVAGPAEDEGAPVSSLHGRTILVVDDNTLIRELFSSYFQELGAECVVAADGPSAVQLAAARGFDAIVLDLALPGIGGAEVARQLRIHAAPGVRIVGVSAHAAEEDRLQAIAAGMDVFLTKPVDLRTLVREIEAPAPKPEALSPKLAGLVERLRTQFRSEAPVLQAALATVVAEADWPAVWTKAHYLKNSADVLGLRELSIACHDLQTAAGRGEAAAARSAVEACAVQLRDWC